MDGTLKVFDFGLSRIVPNSSPQSDETYKLSGGTGSLRYMAPEVARGTSPYNHKADIYSFGIILWELFTFQQPYETMNRKEHYERVVCGGERPFVSKISPNDLANIIRDCWHVDPQKRPTFQSIALALVEMLDNERSKVYKNPSRVGRDKRIHRNCLIRFKQ